MPTPLVATSTPPNLTLFLASNMATIALNQNNTPVLQARLRKVQSTDHFINVRTILKSYLKIMLRVQRDMSRSYSTLKHKCKYSAQTPHTRDRTGAWACRVQFAPLHQKEVDKS